MTPAGITSRDETPASPADVGPSVGRPRRWVDREQRQREYRARRAEKLRLVDELLQAVVNAHWEEPELRCVMNHGTDAEVLQALTLYYRQRHWMHWKRDTEPAAKGGEDRP